MSSDFERELRDAREALPLPDESSTQRARHRAIGSLRRKRRRTRALVVVGAMLVSAVALGVTAGSLNAPSVTAAREPAVLGFVPEPGWFALQSPPPAIEGQQTVAVAANVPFAADDVEDGLVEPSGLPYSTLLTLPPDGIVIVSTMSPLSLPHVAPVPSTPDYPSIELPLRLRDALPVLRWGAQVRPDQPMAQYHLRGHLRGYNVDVIAYFGTPRPSAALMRQAQRQLSGFVVRSEGVDARSRPAAITAPVEPLAVIDRTFACNTVLLGGLSQVEVRAHAGDRRSGQWVKLPYAGVSTGGNAGRLDTSVPPGSALAWITAGPPAPSTNVDDEYDSFSVHSGGTLGRNTELCRPSTARVQLSRAGLRGGVVPVEARAVDCDAPRRVLIRLRATALGSAALRERGRIFVATGTPLSRAELAVRTPNGKLLVYAAVDQSGRSRQYTAPRGCVREP
ncbi:MAG TPA: hypothetical protein VFU84_04935 [Gaiellaceae bacterium]|nr:hypothetical protein [Gaiellaceae bacterium]